MGNKIIKKVIPEIIIIVLLILAAFGYVMSGEYINSYEIYEGQYALQYKNGGRIADIKYVEDLKNLEGVERFAGDSVDTKNWYLMDIYLNTNNEKILQYKNVLVSADGTDDETYKLTIKDGTASIYKSSGDKYAHMGGELILGFDCEFSLYFSGNGIVVKAYKNNQLNYYYMEKVGMLSYLNAQMFQTGCVIVGGVLMAAYLFMVIFRGGRKRLIIVPICAVLIFVGLIFTRNTSVCGEYTNPEEDNYSIIVPGEAKEYSVLIGGKIDSTDVIEAEADLVNGGFKSWDKKIATMVDDYSFIYDKEDTATMIFEPELYSSVTHMPVRDFSYFVYLLLTAVGSVVGFVLRFMIKEKEGTAVFVEEIPYIGIYEVAEPVYLGDSFRGMESYFGANVKGEVVNILPDKFAFMDDEISNPEYDMKKFKNDNFKGNQVVIKDTDFEIYFNDKKTYLAKNMNGIMMVAYRIKKVEA